MKKVVLIGKKLYELRYPKKISTKKLSKILKDKKLSIFLAYNPLKNRR